MSDTPQSFTAFDGQRRLARGALADIALSVRAAADPQAVVIFDDGTGRVIDLDLRGSDEEVRRRYLLQEEPRGRGRPKLGVVSREVTLLPRHWDWLNVQPGGASVALRKLVEEARRASGDELRLKAARDATYRFISTMGGDLPGFEEAIRALYANDYRAFCERIDAWPEDVRDHAIALLFGEDA